MFLEGVDVQQDNHGDEVYSIENILSLHKVIAHAIIGRRGGLSGPELRFLRSEMGLTQEELAKRLATQEAADLSRDQIVRLAVNAFEASWLPAGEKRALLSRLDGYVGSQAGA